MAAPQQASSDNKKKTCFICSLVDPKLFVLFQDLAFQKVPSQNIFIFFSTVQRNPHITNFTLIFERV
jgi:hypothetical protein